ncbi:MAG: LLM class flavin-dependent oxidoreductase [Myxococcota bacterium]|jgi:alkanesulfonate monooxygenase SsuD/methylene tetrahydromethanopterin reductase-like flavin-dependent oxidoreductase (luciferase family)|nr:LLM class flavin-dependent oxidoreductase [Myxococcota bacterium]
MRLGVYLDLRNPPEWQRPWSEHYARSLEWIEEAERLGADSVWLSEHHFFEDGYLPQPLTFAGAVAARTRRMRIGTAILLAPLRSALQIAEEAAVVDCLSGGRLDLGLGAGYVAREFDAYGADLTRRYTTTDNRVREIRALIAGGELTPPPVQAPLPIWLGYQGPQGAARAGRLGTGLLTLGRSSFEPYREGLIEGGHDPALARMAGLVSAVAHDDPDSVREELLPHIAHQLNTYREAGAGRAVRAITPEMLREGDAEGKAFRATEILTPEALVDRIVDQCKGLPAHEAYFWLSVSGMSDDLIQRHLELLCQKVRPALAAL